MGKIFSLLAAIVFLFTASFSVQANELEAQFNKGIELINREDYDAAFDIFSELASQGLVPATHYVGLFHKEGVGTPKKLKKAQEFFEKAASEGYPPSAYALAIMYFEGDISVTEKETQEKTVYWLRRGAELGDPDSQGMLGKVYGLINPAVEDALPKDDILSYMWLTVAVENGVSSEGKWAAVDILAELEHVFTYKNVVEAKKLAKACIKQKFKGCATVSSMTKKKTNVKKPKITKPKANTKASNESGIECNFNKFSGVGQADAEDIVTSYLGEKFILNKADNKITLGGSNGWSENSFEIQQVKENSKFTTYIFKEKLKVSKNKSDPKHTIRRSYRIYKKKNVTKAYGEILNANFPIMIAEGVCN